MYCAYVTRIHNLRKHTNADRLLCGECFGNTVIVDLGTDPDQLGVYFPTDGSLIPVWFTEEETKVANGTMYKTGRVRRACSHLVCEACLKNFCVDDTFDGPWHNRR